MGDNIINGVHGCSEASTYVKPVDPLVIQKLEAFQDKKLGFMMHWAPVTQLGIVESWALSDEDSEWSQKEIDWTDDMDEFKQQYRDLYKTFNPIRYQPKDWAKIAKECGFKYVLFTTKHHDGFCMWDTNTTDYKITSEACPFHQHPYSDIVKHLYDAFREQEISIHTYFSKPDWDCPYYWSKDFTFKDHKTHRNTNYKIEEHPDIWEKFVQFTHAQITELMTNYGEIDCLWLDGGQVNPSNQGQDIRIGELVDNIRGTTQPGLICADRTVGGPYENFITPEQSIPKEPILVPWESCITLGKSFSYHYDETYKTPQEIIHLLIDIVAKGGNLALNMAPQPDGRLPVKGIEVLCELGAFLKIYGDGIYGTRPCEPYRMGQYAFTKKENKLYVFYLYEEGEERKQIYSIPIKAAIKTITKIGSNKSLRYDQRDYDTIVQCDKTDEVRISYIEGFCIQMEK